jgi:predicted enzyme related to lactoylglutathione lyase
MVKYFEDIFGGKVEWRGENRGYPMIRVNVAGALINVHGTDPKAAMLVPGKGSRGLDHMGFKVKDLEKIAAEMKKKGAKFSVPPTVSPSGVQMAFVDGPENIRIELVQRD